MIIVVKEVLHFGLPIVLFDTDLSSLVLHVFPFHFLLDLFFFHHVDFSPSFVFHFIPAASNSPEDHSADTNMIICQW